MLLFFLLYLRKKEPIQKNKRLKTTESWIINKLPNYQRWTKFTVYIYKLRVMFIIKCQAFKSIELWSKIWKSFSFHKLYSINFIKKIKNVFFFIR